MRIRPALHPLPKVRGALLIDVAASAFRWAAAALAMFLLALIAFTSSGDDGSVQHVIFLHPHKHVRTLADPSSAGNPQNPANSLIQ